VKFVNEETFYSTNEMEVLDNIPPHPVNYLELEEVHSLEDEEEKREEPDYGEFKGIDPLPEKVDELI
jgi:hypothetical protein